MSCRASLSLSRPLLRSKSALLTTWPASETVGHLVHFASKSLRQLFHYTCTAVASLAFTYLQAHDLSCSRGHSSSHQGSLFCTWPWDNFPVWGPIILDVTQPFLFSPTSEAFTLRGSEKARDPKKGHFCSRTTSQMVQSEQTWSPLHSIHFKHALNLPFKKFVWVMGRPGPQFSTSDVSLLKVYSSCWSLVV